MSKALANIRINFLKGFIGAGLHWLMLETNITNLNELSEENLIVSHEDILRRLCNFSYEELLEFANLASASANYWLAQVQVNTGINWDWNWNQFDCREKKREGCRFFCFDTVSSGVS